MLTLLFGAPGTGKTTEILSHIERDLAEGTPSFLIVPEQNTVSVEAMAARRLPPNAPLLFEVTNFTRLADTVFRRVGGIATRYADGEAATILTRDAIASVLPMLSSQRLDAKRIARTLRTVKELKASGVSPELLGTAAEAIDDNEMLEKKLLDMSLILAALEATLDAHKTALPSDGLAELARLLTEGRPLAGARFYIDGFTSFTAVQRAVIAGLLRASDLIITLPMPKDGGEDALCYAEIERTVRDLRRLAKEAGIAIATEEHSENKRAKSPILALIGDRLFRTRRSPLPPPTEGEGEALRIFECRTPYSEAELIAADIARRVQEGARYRDFAIVARTAEDYRGVLDTALSRHGIPAYFSLPTDLSAFPAVKLIRAAYAILTDGGRREDVVTYAKCGLSGITADECDRFELYAERWNLTGKALLSIPFSRYPDGYSPPPYENARKEADEALLILNDIRERILTPLKALEKSCKENLTVSEHCRSLYAFLSALDVDKQLYDIACEYAERGECEQADEYARLYATITATLDRLCEFIPDTRLGAAEFSELLSLLFSEKTMRTIPARADAVTVGSADLLRPNEPRHVYLIGVNAGTFPRGGEENGFFSADELIRLEEHGIVLDGNEVVRASREYYCFLRAFLSASESVTISYFLSDFSFTPAGRSEALNAILAMAEDRFPIRNEEKIPLADRLFSAYSAVVALAAPEIGAERDALYRVLTENAEAAPLAERADAPITEPAACAGREAMHELYRGRMQLSQSRIEQYVSCPFSFFCKHVLKLSENRRITFDSAEIGTFIHAILEYFYADERGKSLAALTDEEIEEAVHRLSERYLAALFPTGGITPRLSHRFDRLGGMAVRIMRELRNEAAVSDFTPLFFEYEPSSEDPSRPAPTELTLADGSRVSLIGKIDRVDVYRSEGNAYLRIVDYKTGKKEFSLDDIARGKNLQMLIYLFTLWRSNREGFLRAVGVADGGRILPAGAIYLNLSLSPARLDAPDAVPLPHTARNGLLLNDPDAIRAMDRTESGAFVPIQYGKDGTPTEKSMKNLITLEGMGALAEEVNQTIRTIAEGIAAGHADASPFASGSELACDYCRYAPVCRNVCREKK